MPKKGNNFTITLFARLFTLFPGSIQGKGKLQENGPTLKRERSPPRLNTSTPNATPRIFQTSMNNRNAQ